MLVVFLFILRRHYWENIIKNKIFECGIVILFIYTFLWVGVWSMGRIWEDGYEKMGCCRLIMPPSTVSEEREPLGWGSRPIGGVWSPPMGRLPPLYYIDVLPRTWTIIIHHNFGVHFFREGVCLSYCSRQPGGLRCPSDAVFIIFIFCVWWCPW